MQIFFKHEHDNAHMHTHIRMHAHIKLKNINFQQFVLNAKNDENNTPAKNYPQNTKMQQK